VGKLWMQRIEGFWSRFEPEEIQKKAAFVFIALLAVYSVARGLAAATTRPFWFDELLTLAIASQPSLLEMRAAIARGFDSQPPPFYLVERACLALPISKEIALRLPSILSFPVLLICVFTWVKARGGELIACACALAILSTSLFHMYSIEGRGYMLMNACIALALVCYQRLPSRRWAAILGVSFLLAQLFHYYAVFAMVPFALAEVVFFLKTQRFRWSVWLALACGILPLIVFWPLLATIKIYYGSQVFSRPQLSQLPKYYGSYFLTSHILGIALTVVSIAAIIWSRLWARRGACKKTDAGPRHVALAEGTLLVSLTLLPLILFGLTRVMHGALLDRYTLPATFGLVFGVASGLSMAGPRGAAIIALFAITTTGISETYFWRSNRNESLAHEWSVNSMEQLGDLETFVQSGERDDLPVVFTHAMSYCQLVHYSPPFWTRRLVCLTSRSRELKYENTDTMFLATKGLSDFFPIHLADYDEFTTAHQEFLLYADRSEWPLASLRKDAASMQLLQKDGDMHLFLVKMKKTSAD